MKNICMFIDLVSKKSILQVLFIKSVLTLDAAGIHLDALKEKNHTSTDGVARHTI